jgi:hypothetical protein
VTNVSKCATGHIELAFQELDAMDAPSAESMWQGVVAGVAVIGIVAVIAT